MEETPRAAEGISEQDFHAAAAAKLSPEVQATVDVFSATGLSHQADTLPPLDHAAEEDIPLFSEGEEEAVLSQRLLPDSFCNGIEEAKVNAESQGRSAEYIAFEEYTLSQIHKHVDDAVAMAGFEPVYHDENRTTILEHEVLLLKDRIIIVANPGEALTQDTIKKIVDNLKAIASAPASDPEGARIAKHKPLLDRFTASGQMVMPLSKELTDRANTTAEEVTKEFLQAAPDAVRKTPHPDPMRSIRAFREERVGREALSAGLASATSPPAPLKPWNPTTREQLRQRDYAFRHHIRTKVQASKPPQRREVTKPLAHPTDVNKQKIDELKSVFSTPPTLQELQRSLYEWRQEAMTLSNRTPSLDQHIAAVSKIIDYFEAQQALSGASLPMVIPILRDQKEISKFEAVKAIQFLKTTVFSAAVRAVTIDSLDLGLPDPKAPPIIESVTEEEEKEEEATSPPGVQGTGDDKPKSIEDVD